MRRTATFELRWSIEWLRRDLGTRDPAKRQTSRIGAASIRGEGKKCGVNDGS